MRIHARLQPWRLPLVAICNWELRHRSESRRQYSSFKWFKSPPAELGVSICDHERFALTAQLDLEGNHRGELAWLGVSCSECGSGNISMQ
jgi:hypothetical protein